MCGLQTLSIQMLRAAQVWTLISRGGDCGDPPGSDHLLRAEGHLLGVSPDQVVGVLAAFWMYLTIQDH